MFGGGFGKRGIGIFFVIAGLILICVFIPVWIWSLILGVSLIILGVFFFRSC